MDFPFTTEVDAWVWDTVTSLSGHDENQHLEYKATISPPDDLVSDETEWKRKIEREITAFANANGGIIVFGVDDGGNPSPFERPSHEIKQSVTRFIQNTRPLVDVDIPDPIEVPSDDTDRIILPVRIYEADRKPVLTGDAAVYRRINDRKEPMSREQMESLFVEHDRRQQAIRQLEMEINRFDDIYNGRENRFSMHGKSPPNFHLLNVESLKQVLRENTHLYADEDIQQAVDRVFRALRKIEDQEVYFGRAMNGYAPKHVDSNERFYKEQRRNLNKKLGRLQRELENIAEEADLQVNIVDS
jgi:hypothetical protein